MKKFTLVELIVVLVIISIMASLTMGVASVLRSNGNVDLAARKVTGTLHLARQTAILENQRVALVIPTAKNLTDPVVLNALGIKETLGMNNRCMIICLVETDSAGRSVIQRRITKIDPQGREYVAQRSTVSNLTVLPMRTALETSGCDEVRVHGSNAKVRAIVWKSTGSLTGIMSPIIDVRTEADVNRFFRVAVNWLKGDAKCRLVTW